MYIFHVKFYTHLTNRLFTALSGELNELTVFLNSIQELNRHDFESFFEYQYDFLSI